MGGQWGTCALWEYTRTYQRRRAGAGAGRGAAAARPLCCLSGAFGLTCGSLTEECAGRTESTKDFPHIRGLSVGSGRLEGHVKDFPKPREFLSNFPGLALDVFLYKSQWTHSPHSHCSLRASCRHSPHFVQLGTCLIGNSPSLQRGIAPRPFVPGRYGSTASCTTGR